MSDRDQLRDHDCEAITPDGVCGDSAQLRHWDTETNGRAELHLCGEHWRMWLNHLRGTDAP